MWKWLYFWCQSCVKIASHDLLSSSETGVNPEIKSWRKILPKWAQCQKTIGGIYFTKKRRAETIQPALEFANFKPRLKIGIFKSISWLNGSFFRGCSLGLRKEGAKTYLMAPMSLRKTPIFSVFTSIVHALLMAVLHDGMLHSRDTRSISADKHFSCTAATRVDVPKRQQLFILDDWVVARWLVSFCWKIFAKRKGLMGDWVDLMVGLYVLGNNACQ
jgi:hypothetical protein